MSEPRGEGAHERPVRRIVDLMPDGAALDPIDPRTSGAPVDGTLLAETCQLVPRRSGPKAFAGRPAELQGSRPHRTSR